MPIKVHFAGSDNTQCRLVGLKAANVNYRLFTCYPFINRKRPRDDMRIKGFFEARVPMFEHVIMDSGLFTLMFGAESGVARDEAAIEDWQDRIVRFVEANGITASVVECDCQKVVSPEYAWELRRDLKRRLPGHEIINVWHLEDGKDGFLRLVEFSDYIAISVPELRIAQPKSYKGTVSALARLARRVKPGIKIHLLGCTELELLKRNSFCTSSDSSSWISPIRYGYLKGRHIDGLKKSAIQARAASCLAAAAKYGISLSQKALADSAKTSICASYSLGQYSKAAGNQD